KLVAPADVGIDMPIIQLDRQKEAPPPPPSFSDLYAQGKVQMTRDIREVEREREGRADRAPISDRSASSTSTSDYSSRTSRSTSQGAVVPKVVLPPPRVVPPKPTRPVPRDDDDPPTRTVTRRTVSEDDMTLGGAGSGGTRAEASGDRAHCHLLLLHAKSPRRF